MRLLTVALLFINVSFALAASPSVQFLIALFCPEEKIWDWFMDASITLDSSPGSIVQYWNDTGVSTDHLQILGRSFPSNPSLFQPIVSIWHSCNSQRVEFFSLGGEFVIPIHDKQEYFALKAVNLQTNTESADIYEKLLLEILNLGCPFRSCHRDLENIRIGCGLRRWGADECMEGLERALTSYCEQKKPATPSICKSHLKSTTTSPTNTTRKSRESPEDSTDESFSSSLTLIGTIIGFVVIIIIIIAGFLLYIRYKRPEKWEEVNETNTGTGLKTGGIQAKSTSKPDVIIAS